MIRIRWAVFAIALGCLLATGLPAAANASASVGAIHASSQGLRAASARAAHSERTAPPAPRDRPAHRRPAPAHRVAAHPRPARNRGRTHQPNAVALSDRNYFSLTVVELMNPDPFRAMMGETERALGSRGPPRASPPVNTARVEPPPSSTAPSVLSVSSAPSIRAPPFPSPAPPHFVAECRSTHAVRHEGTAAGVHLPSGEIRS